MPTRRTQAVVILMTPCALLPFWGLWTRPAFKKVWRSACSEHRVCELHCMAPQSVYGHLCLSFSPRSRKAAGGCPIKGGSFSMPVVQQLVPSQSPATRHVLYSQHRLRPACPRLSKGRWRVLCLPRHSARLPLPHLADEEHPRPASSRPAQLARRPPCATQRRRGTPPPHRSRRDPN